MPAARVADRCSPAAAHSLYSSPLPIPTNPNSSESRIIPITIASEQKMIAPQYDTDFKEEAIKNDGIECTPSVAMADLDNVYVKTEEELRQERELHEMLLAQRERLEETLVERLEQLKKLCISEGELTGQLPKEIYKTLLPGESEPQVKRRVGTAFKFPEELIQQKQNSDDQIGRMEAEIELNRRIVAAAERLASDRSANKSVRKKRRKDLQAATLRLRGLEKGLYRMRLSSSKPDISSLIADGTSSTIGKSGVKAGSGFSLNSLKHWPNFYNSIRVSTKSCPSTPRGSVPDLTASSVISAVPGARKQTPTTAKKLHNLLKGHQQHSAQHCANGHKFCTSASSSAADSASNSGGCPSSCSLLSLNGPSNGPQTGSCAGTISATTSTSSGISSAATGSALISNSNLYLAAPPVPKRRLSAGNALAGNAQRPTPPRQRRSASRDRSIDYGNASEHPEDLAPNHLYANIGYTSSAPYKSAYRQSNFPTMHSPSSRSPQNASSAALSTNFSPNVSGAYYEHRDNHALTAAASNQLGRIVRQLGSAQHHSSSALLCRPIPVSGPSTQSSSSALPLVQRITGSYSTTSLDRRAIKAAAANGSRFLMRDCQERRNEAANQARKELVAKLHSSQQQTTTTFPVNETFRPLESADFARFRSISAILDHQKRTAQLQKCSPPQKQLPSRDERMEALLASLHSQNRPSRDASPAMAPKLKSGVSGTVV